MQMLATQAYVYLPRKTNSVETNGLSRQLVVHKQISQHRAEVQGMTVLHTGCVDDEPMQRQAKELLM